MRQWIVWGVVLVLVPLVSAGLDIQESTLEFGGSSQEKSGATRLVYATKLFTLRLSSGFRYENFNFEFTPSNNFQTTNLQFVNLSGSVNASGGDQTRQFTVNLTVPRDFDAVNNNLDPTRFSIGRLKMKADRINESNPSPQPEQSDEMELFLQVKNNLEIRSVKIERESGAESSVGRGSTIEVEAGERVKMKFEIKNNFENESGTSLETVTIRMESSDIGINENEEINGIEPNTVGNARVTTDIDDEETGTFDVNVDVSGEDESQGLHGATYDFKFNVVAAAVNPDDEVPLDSEDTDGDGVPDLDDFCPVSTPQCTVDESGCEIDTDKDGTCDSLDQTPQGKPKIELENERNPLSGGNGNKTTTEETTKNKSEILTSVSTEAFAPFLIGFALGLMLTAGFFIFIRS